MIDEYKGPMSKKKKKRPWVRQLAQWTRPVRYALVPLVIQSVGWAVRLLSHRGALGLGRWLGRMGWRLAPGLRKLTCHQLQEAGLAHGAQEARELGRRSFESVCMSIIELLHSQTWGTQGFKDKIDIKGQENLELAQRDGKGVICFSGHLGNWELMCPAFSNHSGIAVTGIMAPQRNPGLNRWLIQTRQKFQYSLLCTNEGSTAPLRKLRRGEILAMLIDQDSKRVQGVFCGFLWASGQNSGRPGSVGNTHRRTPVAGIRLASHG